MSTTQANNTLIKWCVLCRALQCACARECQSHQIKCSWYSAVSPCMHVFTTAQVSVPAIPQLVAIAIIVGIDSDFQIKPFIFCKRSTYQYTPDSILYSAKELISLRQDRPFGSTRFRRAAWSQWLLIETYTQLLHL